MRLADLRKLTIKQQVRIRFTLPNGMECLVTEHGIAQVPALQSVPHFNLEQDLESVQQFLLEPVSLGPKKKVDAPRRVTREQLAAMAGANPSDADHHEEHDE